MTTNIKQLSLLGLTEKEILVFQALLKHGLMDVSDIAVICDIKRSSIYLYLEQLKEKGLVIEVQKDNKKYFQALRSNNLKQLVKARISSLEKLEKALPAILKPNQTKQESSESVTIYKGILGLKTVLEEVAGLNEDAYYLGSVKHLYKYITGGFLNKIYTKRRRQKALTTDFYIGDWAETTVKNYYRESGTFTKRRFLPKDMKVDCGIALYADKVTIGLFNPEPYTIVIEDKSLVEALKMAYLSLFKDLEGKNIPPNC